MDVIAFTDWAREYIASRGWNIPVMICQGDYVRIGAEIRGVKAYDDYSGKSIREWPEEKLKSLVIINLDRLKLRAEALSRSENMMNEVRKQLGKINRLT